MKRFLVIFLLLVSCFITQVAIAEVTITLTDGVETRTISLNEDQTAKLESAMNYMGAKKYKLDTRVDPMVENGNTVLQQLKAVIIQIVWGIYRDVEENEVDEDAKTKKDQIQVSSAPKLTKTVFAGIEYDN